MHHIYILHKGLKEKNHHKVILTMGENATQFSIKIETKNILDKLKAEKKEEIIKQYKKKKRYVTNDDIIRYLIDKNKQTNKQTKIVR